MNRVKNLGISSTCMLTKKKVRGSSREATVEIRFDVCHQHILLFVCGRWTEKWKKKKYAAFCSGFWMLFLVCILDFATPINNISRNLLKLFHNLLQPRILLMTHTKKLFGPKLSIQMFYNVLSEQMRLRYGIVQENVDGKKFYRPTTRLKNNPEMRTNRCTVGTDRETMRKSLLYNCFIMNEWRHSVVAAQSLARYDINYVHDTVVFYECSFIYTRYSAAPQRRKSFFLSLPLYVCCVCVKFPRTQTHPTYKYIWTDSAESFRDGDRGMCSNVYEKHRQSIYYVCATVKWFKTIAKWLRTIFSFCWIHSIY